MLSTPEKNTVELFSGELDVNILQLRGIEYGACLPLEHEEDGNPIGREGRNSRSSLSLEWQTVMCLPWVQQTLESSQEWAISRDQEVKCRAEDGRENVRRGQGQSDCPATPFRVHLAHTTTQHPTNEPELEAYLPHKSLPARRSLQITRMG